MGEWVEALETRGKRVRGLLLQCCREDGVAEGGGRMGSAGGGWRRREGGSELQE